MSVALDYYSGIYLIDAGSGVALSDVTISNFINANGITLLNSNPTLQNCTIQDNGGFGIYVDGTSAPTIDSFTAANASGNTSGSMGFSPDGANAAQIYDGILPTEPVYVVAGTVYSNAAWQSSRVYYLKGEVAVNSGVTLTIDPGVVIKFASKVRFYISGTLNANGTLG